MTIRNTIRDWLGIERTHRLMEESACCLLDVQKDLKRIEAKIDGLRPLATPVFVPVRLAATTWEAVQQNALKEFDESKRGN